ncbi:hypothetical protein AB447_220815 [Bacillus glycinifermentans]|uniref:Gamma-glutamyltransferase n=1 Tax=Bacillus glycinifermentans TaxID=1664069 RepID=A0A0T6BMU0_9BACI|nr:hypothetical protein AB447_220815 [Bacillus glycinifermentans]
MLLETSVPQHIAQALSEKGHQIEWAFDSGSFGRGQVILRHANGVLAGGTEARTHGSIASW